MIQDLHPVAKRKAYDLVGSTDVSLTHSRIVEQVINQSSIVVNGMHLAREQSQIGRAHV